MAAAAAEDLATVEEILVATRKKVGNSIFIQIIFKPRIFFEVFLFNSNYFYLMKSQYIIGRNAVLEALITDVEFEKIHISKTANGDIIKEIIEKARDRGIYVQFVPEIKLDYLSKQPHQGVVGAINLVSYFDFQDIINQCFDEGRTPLVVVLDGITDVRNFGAIARTALGLNVDLIIIPKKESVSISADAIKTSAGALMKIPVCKTDNLIATIKDLKLNGLKIVGLTGNSKQHIYDVDLKVPLALVLGAEDKGISSAVIKLLDENVQLPMNEALESYNVSVANALALYQIYLNRII
jgi:23S rRNA (guanosine2251-2'-O)-methyltransferase